MDGMDKLVSTFRNRYKTVTGKELPVIDDLLEFEQLKADSLNEAVGSLDKVDGINCDLCKNKGFIHKVKMDDNNEPVMYSQECGCQKKRTLIRKAIRSGLGQYLSMKSKDYIVTEQWQKDIRSKFIDYCQNHQNDNVWFTMLGQSGSGKTMVCSIVANHLLKNVGRDVLYVTWTDFISQLKRDLMDKNISAVNEYLETIKNADVLFLDELLKVYSEADVKYIIEILNYRYSSDLKTIITSERTPDELLNIDEATFGRVIEKSGNFIISVAKDRSKNYRLKGVFNQ